MPSRFFVTSLRLGQLRACFVNRPISFLLIFLELQHASPQSLELLFAFGEFNLGGCQFNDDFPPLLFERAQLLFVVSPIRSSCSEIVSC